MRHSRRFAIVASVLLVILAGGSLVVMQRMAERAGGGTASGTVSIGGPFTLVEGSGKTVTEQDFQGKWLLVFFGYTHCPDVCPTTLNTVANALDELPAADRDKVRALFVTVDPDRDTPAVMQDYVAGFANPLIIGLSGSDRQIEGAMKAYRVYAAKHPEGDGEYSMDHSAFVYIMNPEGSYQTHVGFDIQPDELAKKLEGLVS
jgi:protein SCO1/2